MRLLLDECVPRPLLRDLTGHDAHHVVDLGWSSKRNGELLKLMVAEHFEALLTVDRNLPFQQNLRERHCRRDSGGPHEPCEGAASAHAEGSRRPSDREGR
jgi:hypothetical protein